MPPASPAPQEQPPREDFTYIDYSAVRHLVDHIPHPFRAVGNFFDDLSRASGNLAGPQTQTQPQQQPAQVELAKPDFTELERREAALARLEALQTRAHNPLSRLATSALVKVQKVLTFQEHENASEQAKRSQR
jgi:hypothetical protein